MFPSARNVYQRQLIRNLREWGWSVTYVYGCDSGPCFACSIGLLASCDHPEIIVVGVPEVTAHGLITEVARRALRGAPVDLSVPNDRIIKGYPCIFCEVSRANREQYALSDCWLYGGSDFPLYQLVWPSEDGLFPWHPDASAKFRASQPLLGNAAAAG